MAACIPVKSYLIRLLVKKSLLLKMQQLILETGTAIWWSTEPHYGGKKFYKIWPWEIEFYCGRRLTLPERVTLICSNKFSSKKLELGFFGNLLSISGTFCQFRELF